MSADVLSVTEEELLQMETRATHRVEPWRVDAKDLVELRTDNRRLIEEVRKLLKAVHRYEPSA